MGGGEKKPGMMEGGREGGREAGTTALQHTLAEATDERVTDRK